MLSIVFANVKYSPSFKIISISQEEFRFQTFIAQVEKSQSLSFNKI
jgi:hypothetical protein